MEEACDALILAENGAMVDAPHTDGAYARLVELAAELDMPRPPDPRLMATTAASERWSCEVGLWHLPHTCRRRHESHWAYQC